METCLAPYHSAHKQSGDAVQSKTQYCQNIQSLGLRRQRRLHAPALLNCANAQRPRSATTSPRAQSQYNSHNPSANSGTALRSSGDHASDGLSSCMCSEWNCGCQLHGLIPVRRQSSRQVHPDRSRRYRRARTIRTIPGRLLRTNQERSALLEYEVRPDRMLLPRRRVLLVGTPLRLSTASHLFPADHRPHWALLPPYRRSAHACRTAHPRGSRRSARSRVRMFPRIHSSVLWDSQASRDTQQPRLPLRWTLFHYMRQA